MEATVMETIPGMFEYEIWMTAFLTCKYMQEMCENSHQWHLSNSGFCCLEPSQRFSDCICELVLGLRLIVVGTRLRDATTASVSRCLYFVCLLTETGSEMQQLHLWAGVCPISDCRRKPAKRRSNCLCEPASVLCNIVLSNWHKSYLNNAVWLTAKSWLGNLLQEAFVNRVFTTWILSFFWVDQKINKAFFEEAAYNRPSFSRLSVFQPFPYQWKQLWQK